MATNTLSLDFGPDKAKFYVYLYRDPRPGKDNRAIYIGKGSAFPGRPAWRARTHWLHGNNVNKIFSDVLNKIRAQGLVPAIEILSWFDDELSAFELEISLIAKVGRRDKGLGPLCNMTDGGDGLAGRMVTPEIREKHRVSGKLSWDLATPEEQRAMLSGVAWHVDPEFDARRRVAIQSGRDNQTPEERAAHNAAVQVAQLARRDDASEKAILYRQTASEETLATHNGNVKKAKMADAEGIGKTSSEVWNRPGMRELISSAISVGQTADWEGNEERHETARLNVKKQFADPVKRERHSNGCAARMKADWADPVKREQMLEARRAKKAARKAAEEKLL